VSLNAALSWTDAEVDGGIGRAAADRPASGPGAGMERDGGRGLARDDRLTLAWRRGMNRRGSTTT
jgi:hypothetical protein